MSRVSARMEPSPMCEFCLSYTTRSCAVCTFLGKVGAEENGLENTKGADHERTLKRWQYVLEQAMTTKS